MMIPSTAERVSGNTSRAANRRIQADIEASVRWHAARPQRIGARLRELDEEWDIERALEANAAGLVLTGSLLSGLVDRRWVAIPVIVSSFLLQHALQGWCPPVPLLRRLGFRTAREIERERVALKAIRNDFAGIHEARDRASASLRAAAM